MLVRRLIELLTLVALTTGWSVPRAPVALAGPDVCPEPNDRLETACYLGPRSAAEGFLESADDVDSYRIELPAGAMVAATLAVPVASYGLRLLRADGSVRAEAVADSALEATVRADALLPGVYFLAVYSADGRAQSEWPYEVSVSFPPSVTLTLPASGVPTTWPYVPRPAERYALRPDEVGLSFHEALAEAEQTSTFSSTLAEQDATMLDQCVWPSRSNGLTVCQSIYVEPYGANDEIVSKYERTLSSLTSSGAKVERAEGWSLERVYRYTFEAANLATWIGRAYDGRPLVRGILLKHLNAVVDLSAIGREENVPEAKIARLARLIEARIHAAIVP